MKEVFIIFKIVSKTPEILDRKIVSQEGPFVRVRTWLEGRHPGGVVIKNGWNGEETVVDRVGIKPIETFWVGSKSENNFSKDD